MHQYSLRKQFMIRTVFTWNTLSCNLVGSPNLEKYSRQKLNNRLQELLLGRKLGWMICKVFSSSDPDSVTFKFKVIEMFLGARNPKIIVLSNFSVFILPLSLMSAQKHLNLIIQKTSLKLWGKNVNQKFYKE